MTAVADPAQNVVTAQRGPRTFWIGVALVLMLMILGLLALLLITPSRPPGDASAVSGTFLGYTNNGAGKRQTQFEEMKEAIRRKLRGLDFRLRGARPSYAGFSNEVAPDHRAAD